MLWSIYLTQIKYWLHLFQLKVIKSFDQPHQRESLLPPLPSLAWRTICENCANLRENLWKSGNTHWVSLASVTLVLWTVNRRYYGYLYSLIDISNRLQVSLSVSFDSIRFIVLNRLIVQLTYCICLCCGDRLLTTQQQTLSWQTNK